MSLQPDRAETGARRRPTFSFLTTAYRSERTLGRTIAAVRAQTWDDWELIVVDNGYDDAIADVVVPFLSDSRIRLVRQENKGPGGGVMAAAKVAIGKYVTVLNSDDSVTPEFCARLGAVLRAEPNVDAVTCDAFLFSDPGTRIGPKSYLENAGMQRPPDARRPLRLADVIDGPCPYYSAAVRREVWQALGGMTCDTPIVDDLDFWLRMLVAGHDVRMVPDRLGLFLIESGSESRPSSVERIEEFERQREQALTKAAAASSTVEDRAALERVLARLRYFQALRRARVAFLGGDREAARNHARNALRLRSTLRARSILIALHVAPGLLTWMHPVKQRMAAWATRARSALVP